jgi:glyoxalase-like protein
VPLGGDYVEVLAIIDAEEAAESPIGRAIARHIGRGDGLLGWAVTAPDVTAIARRLEVELVEVERDGKVGRLAGLPEALAEPFLPFFIERPDSDEPGGISWIEVAGDRERLDDWLGGADALPVHVLAGEPALLAIGVGDRVVR